MKQEQADSAAPNTTPVPPAKPVAQAAQPAMGTATSTPNPTAPSARVHCPYRGPTICYSALLRIRCASDSLLAPVVHCLFRGADGEPLIPGIAGLTEQGQRLSGQRR